MCVLQVVMFISAPWYPTRWTVNETECSSDASFSLLSAPNVQAVGTSLFQCTYNHSYLGSLFVSTTSIDYKWTDAKVRYCVCVVYLFVLHLSTGTAVKWLAAKRAVGLQVEFPLSTAGLDCVSSNQHIPCVPRIILLGYDGQFVPRRGNGHPNRLGGPPNLIFNKYRWLFVYVRCCWRGDSCRTGLKRGFIQGLWGFVWGSRPQLVKIVSKTQQEGP